MTWQVALGSPILAAPAVANGVVYITAQAGPQPHVFALDAATGDVLLDMSLGADSLSAPIVADGLVLLDAGDGNLYRLSLGQ